MCTYENTNHFVGGRILPPDLPLSVSICFQEQSHHRVEAHMNRYIDYPDGWW